MRNAKLDESSWNQDCWDLWDAAKAVLRGKFIATDKSQTHSNTILPQEARKTPKRQPDFTPKTTGK